MKNSPHRQQPIALCALHAPAREALTTLPKSIKARINQFAHQSEQRHASTVRDSMFEALRQAVRSGARQENLSATLDAIEAVAMDGHFETNQNSKSKRKI